MKKVEGGLWGTEEIYLETQENKGSMPVLIWANNNIGSILINTDLTFEYDPGLPKLDYNHKKKSQASNNKGKMSLEEHNPK